MQVKTNQKRQKVKNLYWFVYFSKWQDMRNPWFIMSIIMISLVLIAHFLFQEYLY
ncbi:hypothetical protein VWM73_11940, partial [Campylobacter coli]